MTALKAGVEHSRQALALSRVRYSNGVADFITVLDAERTLLASQQQLAQSTTAVSTNLIQLYKALGGGWQQTFPRSRRSPSRRRFRWNRDNARLARQIGAQHSKAAQNWI